MYPAPYSTCFLGGWGGGYITHRLHIITGQCNPPPSPPQIQGWSNTGQCVPLPQKIGRLESRSEQHWVMYPSPTPKNSKLESRSEQHWVMCPPSPKTLRSEQHWVMYPPHPQKFKIGIMVGATLGNVPRPLSKKISWLKSRSE